MEAYRDQYATLFRGGRDITLIAVSTDSQEDLRSWAKDADFPFLFASDEEGTAANAFGVGLRDSGVIQLRSVIVVDPEGKVAWTAAPFREIDPTAYVELGEALEEIAPPLEAMEHDPGDAEVEAASGLELLKPEGC